MLNLSLIQYKGGGNIGGNILTNKIKTKKFIYFFMVLVVFFVICSLNGVNANNVTISNNTTISTAISQINGSGGEIYLESGIYSGNGNTKQIISKNLSIVGSDNTIINGENKNWIFNVNAGITLNLINLTIINTYSTTKGGALLNSGNLNLINCTIINAYSTNNGGAIHNNGGTLNVEGSLFINSSSAGKGGVISSEKNGVKLPVTIVNNSEFINSSSNNNGGAIYGAYANITVLNSNFTNTNATGKGGVIICESEGNLVIANSIFINNTAKGNGGAIQNSDGNGSIINSTFINSNSTGGKGGSINSEAAAGSFLDVINCTFINSSAKDHGGAIQHNDGKLVVNGSFFTNCYSGNKGGAIYGAGAANSLIINYNKFCKITDASKNYTLDTDGRIRVNADYNWWGVNNVTNKTNVITNNHYILVIVPTYTSELSYGDVVKFDLFYLNNTNDTTGVEYLPLLNIGILYNNESLNPVNGSDNFELSLKVNSVGANILNVTLCEENIFYIFGVVKAISHLVVEGNNGSVGDVVQFNTTLTDQNNDPIPNQLVNLTIDGVNYELRTDEKGVARLNYTITKAGNFTLYASYNSEFYEASYNSTLVSFVKTPTIVEVFAEKGTVGKSIKLRAKVTKINGTPIVDKIVDFYVNNKFVGSSKTNSEGIAYLSYIPTKAGNFEIYAQIHEDSTHLASKGDNILTIESDNSGNNPHNGNNTNNGTNGNNGDSDENKNYSSVHAGMKKTTVPVFILALLFLFTFGAIRGRKLFFKK